MDQDRMNVVSAAVTIRPANIRDISGIMALKRRIHGVSLPWGDEELASQIVSFPEGQIVAVNSRSRQVIGALGTLVIARSHYSLLANWGDMTAEGTFRNHDPSRGKTLFRSHLIVDPRFDCTQLRDLLSEAELGLATRLGLDRIRAGVRFKDYYLFHHLAPIQYLREIEQGLVADSWVSQTLARGFKALAVVTGYYPKDWRSDGYAVVAQLELRSTEEKAKAEFRAPRDFASTSAAAVA